MSARQELTAWLLAEGGPIVRLRTLEQLVPDAPPREVDALRDRAMKSPLVARWLAHLTGRTGFTDLHGFRPTHFENAAGKLAQLGCRAGFAALDRGTAPVRRWHERSRSPDFVELYCRVLAAAFLEVCGYGDEPSVRTAMRERLDALFDFTRQRCFDIYVPASVPGYPRHFAGVPLVDPRLHPAGLPPLPSIVDAHALAALRARCDAQTVAKIDTVMRWIVSEECRALAPGYGAMQIGPRRFWKIGWDVRLGDGTAPVLLQNLELLAHFPDAVASPWFRTRLAGLEEHRTPEGRYRFPRDLLREGRTGYWVNGSYMALDDGRRSHAAVELESTFRALRIQTLAERSARACAR